MKKKICFTFPHLSEFGGGEIFCEYLCNYLSQFYKIDLVFYKSNQINQKLRFNKNINLVEIKSNNFFVNYFCKKYIAIAQLFIIKYLSNKKYFFIFSGAGEFFNKNSTVYQYIHHPFYSLNPVHYLSMGLKKNNLIKISLRFFLSIYARILFKINQSHYLKTYTIVNSNWIKFRVKQIYPYLKSKVVYPTFKIPEFSKINFQKFEKKNNDFVILGRVSRDKKTIEGINFFLNFKKNNRHLNIGKLHIIGPVEKKIENKVNKIKKLFINDCCFHSYLSLKKRDKILKKSKYGLHFFHGEHFGRSILEMQKMGLIVFAHNSGGSREILLSKLQKYNNFIDLENNINQVMLNNLMRKKIFKTIKDKLKDNFTDKQFKNNIKKILN